MAYYQNPLNRELVDKNLEYEAENTYRITIEHNVRSSSQNTVDYNLIGQ